MPLDKNVLAVECDILEQDFVRISGMTGVSLELIAVYVIQAMDNGDRLEDRLIIEMDRNRRDSR
jgi:hypothetical protein